MNSWLLRPYFAIHSYVQTKRNESDGDNTEIKKGNYLYQPLETINAPSVQEIKRLLEGWGLFI